MHNIKIIYIQMFLKIIFALCLLLTICRCETLYQILELSPQANTLDIKKAFRKLSIKYHPDKNVGNEAIQKRYLQISRAYEILMDVAKRITYDLYGEQGLVEIQKHPKPKGGDYRPAMDVTLRDFYVGSQKVFSFRRGEICKHCKGTGDTTAKMEKCPACGGTGKIFKKVKVGAQSKTMQVRCKQCDGKGVAGKQNCPVCRGQKIQMKPRDLPFQIQKGMSDGEKITFKGQSEQGLEFYPGDVILTLNQIPDKRFRRQGNNLYIDLDIELKDAILGFDRIINHLDDHQVLISSEKVLQDGQEIVIPGQGMPIRGEFGLYGNLHVKIHVNFPRDYSFSQLDRIRKIFDLGTSEQL